MYVYARSLHRHLCMYVGIIAGKSRHPLATGCRRGKKQRKIKKKILAQNERKNLPKRHV